VPHSPHLVAALGAAFPVPRCTDELRNDDHDIASSSRAGTDAPATSASDHEAGPGTGTTPPTAATAATSTASRTSRAGGSFQLCHWRTDVVGCGQKDLVLRAPSHRVPHHSGAASTSSTNDREASPTAAPNAGDNFVSLRLQCRLFQLGEGMACGKEGLLLQNCASWLLACSPTSTSGDNIPAL